MRLYKAFLFSLALVLAPCHAEAEFIISSAVIEFSPEGPKQHDIELISRGDDTDYIETEISRILNPGIDVEERALIDDPTDSALIVTPDRLVLAGHERRVARFVLMKPLDDKEHVYRVAFKPVIGGLRNTDKLGLKVLVGYEVLVLIRPQTILSRYEAKRGPQMLTIRNTGNASIFLQNGHLCKSDDDCNALENVRIYPGQTKHVALRTSGYVTYSVWDGKETVTKRFE